VFGLLERKHRARTSHPIRNTTRAVGGHGRAGRGFAWQHLQRNPPPGACRHRAASGINSKKADRDKARPVIPTKAELQAIVTGAIKRDLRRRAFALVAILCGLRVSEPPDYLGATLILRTA
jgi:hypothetical protein